VDDCRSVTAGALEGLAKKFERTRIVQCYKSVMVFSSQFKSRQNESEPIKTQSA
jgi:hypothetical protein